MIDRQHTIELLADMRMPTTTGDELPHPSTWTHRDGTPVTPSEVDTIMVSTADDWQAASDLWNAWATAAQVGADASERLGRLTDPLFAEHADCRTIGDCERYLTGDDLTEYRELLAVLGATR